MKFGLSYFATDEGPDPVGLAKEIEQRGFEAIFLPEHTHIPASRETPYPAGEELPREYWRTYDPFVLLSAISSATTTLKLGTGICLIVERDPITTAKEVASIDSLSGGRFLFGIGAGWNVEEMENHGTDPSRRFGLMRERVEAMKAIWTEEEASYDGEQVSFDRIWSWPKPAQKPHPPILLGGNGKGVPDRVLRYGDEWFPNRIGDDDRFIARIEKLIRRGREEAGREIGVTVQLAPTDPSEIERFAEAGVHRCAWYLPPRDSDAIGRALDRYTEVIQAYS
ncbi:LLM class F420-dependent oxidoreductase [soil metagenome]